MKRLATDIEVRRAKEELTTDIHEVVRKKYIAIVEQLQGTLAIGDYEELFFNFLKGMNEQTHSLFFDGMLLILQNTYDQLIEDIYHG